MTDDASRWLPSLEALRASGVPVHASAWWKPFGFDLLAQEPDSSERLAAVIVRARAHRRLVTHEEIEAAADDMPAEPRGVPTPIPWQAASQRVLLAALGPVHACTLCSMSPGKVPCTTCGGSGRIHLRGDRNSGDATRPCPACHQKGSVACGTCNGSGRAQPASSAIVDDRVDTLRYVFVPPLSLELEGRLRARLDALDPPASLVTELDARPPSGYRDVEAHDPTFYGFSYGDALGRARAAVRGVGGEGELVTALVEAWSWPFLRLRYDVLGPDREVAVFVDVAGQYQVVVARADDDA